MSENIQLYLPLFENVARDCGEAARTYGALVDSMRPKWNRCWRAHEEIAKLAGLSVWTVRKHLKVLVAKGWIVDLGRVDSPRKHTYEIYSSLDRDPRAPAPTKSATIKVPHWRFPKSERNYRLREWSQVIVYACVSTLAKDTDVIHLSKSGVGFGYSYLVKKLGITKEQARRAVQALVKKRLFAYVPTTAQVVFPAGWRESGVQYNEAAVEGVATDATASGGECNPTVADDPTGGGVGCERNKANPNQPNPKELNPKKPNPSRAGSSDLSQRRVPSAEEVSVRFIQEVGMFANIHTWPIEYSELQEVALALVIATWDEDPEIEKFRQKSENGALINQVHDVIQEVLEAYGTDKHSTSPVGLIYYRLVTPFDKAHGTTVRKTLSKYRTHAKGILPRLLELSKLHEGVNFPARRTCVHCPTKSTATFTDQKRDGAWTKVDSQQRPTCDTCAERLKRFHTPRMRAYVEY